MKYFENEVQQIKDEISNGCSRDGLIELKELLEENKGLMLEVVENGVDLSIDLNTVDICLSLLEQAISPVQ